MEASSSQDALREPELAEQPRPLDDPTYTFSFKKLLAFAGVQLLVACQGALYFHGAVACCFLLEYLEFLPVGASSNVTEVSCGIIGHWIAARHIAQRWTPLLTNSVKSMLE